MFRNNRSLFSILVLFLSVTQLSYCAPVVTLKNGTYIGIYDSEFNQDIFLGMPFAKPPTGQRRLRIPESLDATWSEIRPAMAFGNSCPQYILILYYN